MEHLDLRMFHLFTHAGCMDGAASAILFMHAGGKRENINFVAAGHVEDNLDGNFVTNMLQVPLLFVDVAPTKEETARWISSRKNSYVIDHHASAVKFAGMPGFLIDTQNTACGCENFRRWLVRAGMIKFDRESFKRFTRLVDDHDRWQLNYSFSLEMPKLFSFIGQNDFIKRFYNVDNRFSQESESYWDPFEKQLMEILAREQEYRFQKLFKRFVIIPREVNGEMKKFAYVVSGEVNCSEFLNAYLDQNPEVDCAVQINPDLNKVSLRSNGKVDITKFVAKYGGGGHPNSGGQDAPYDLTRKVAELLHG